MNLQLFYSFKLEILELGVSIKQRIVGLGIFYGLLTRVHSAGD